MTTQSKLAIMVLFPVLCVYTPVARPATNDNKVEFEALCEVFRQLEFISNQTEKSILGSPRDEWKEARASVQLAENLIEGKNVTTEAGETTQEANRGQQESAKTPVLPRTPFGVYIQRQAASRVKNILERLKPGSPTDRLLVDKESRVNSDLTTIKGLISKAICGVQESSTDLRVCGTDNTFSGGLTAGSTTGAGKSLASDMAYLCKTDSSSNECVGTVDAGGAAGNAATAQTMYKKLVHHCVKEGGNPIPISEHSLQGALQNFYNHLNRQTKLHGSLAKYTGAVLGKYAPGGDEECGASANVCINYGARTDTKVEIPWVAQLKQIAPKWTKLVQDAIIVNRTLAEIRKTRESAWQEYEAAKLAENVTMESVGPAPWAKGVSPPSEGIKTASKAEPYTSTTSAASDKARLISVFLLLQIF